MEVILRLHWGMSVGTYSGGGDHTAEFNPEVCLTYAYLKRNAGWKWVQLVLTTQGDPQVFWEWSDDD